MATYVLVAGFWLGGWAWDGVASALRADGHEVHALSLALEPGTTAEDHVASIAAAVRGLEDAVLVGHSYGGLVTTAAADRVASHVRRLVYVDTGPLPSGMAQADFDGARPVAVDGMLPVPQEAPATAAGFDWSIIRERGRPQPVETATDPIRHGTAWQAIPRTGILCSFTEKQLRAMAPGKPVFELMVAGDWTYHDLTTGHWPMFSEPGALTAILDAAGRTENGG